MPGDQAVSKFRYGRNSRNALIGPKWPLPSVGQRTKDGFCSTVNSSVRFDDLDGLIEAFARNFRESLGDARMLERQVIDVIARDLPPTSDPIAAEVAIAIEDQKWFRRRRTDLDWF